MDLVIIRHAGVVMDVELTDNAEEWMATKGKEWKKHYVSAEFKFLSLAVVNVVARTTAAKKTGHSTGEK